MSGYGYSEKLRLAPLERTPSGRPLPNLRRRVPQKVTYLLASVVLIFLFYLTHNTKAHHTTDRRGPHSTRLQKLITKGDLPCRSLPGADDVVVILKTGSTEVQDKLPIHLNTTLRCYPHSIIFSDYEETFQSSHVYDALEFVNASIKNTHPDFELWRRLQRNGRQGLKAHELSGPISKPQTDARGKPSNPGWKLDKWKFLPMVNRTLHEYPDKKWYVFVETDTYVMWQTLLNYLGALDARKPYYIGGQIWIGNIQFAHGGTGFAVSRPAMRSVVDMFEKEQTQWERFTDEHWAGDCVLGKAFKESGTNLTEAWPIWQGDDVGKMTWARKDGPGEGYRQWCMPSVSYHHLAPSVVEDLWRFEQDWMGGAGKDPSKSLRHKDTFHEYVLSRMGKSKIDWFNHADQDRGPVPSLEACEELCEADESCLQYALRADFRCLVSKMPNLGGYEKGVESGWMVRRIEKWAAKMEACPKKSEWIA